MGEKNSHMVDESPLAFRIGARREEEKAIIERLCRGRRPVGTQTDLIYQGQSVRRGYILISGWASSYKMMPDGSRQIIDIRIPGDFMGLQSMLLRRSGYTTRPITDIQVAEIQLDDLFEVFACSPELARAILRTVSQDGAAIAERLVSLGRRTAFERVAHFMLELGARLALVGQGDETGFACPLTQYHLADALGLSAVHTNRIIRQLRVQGMMTFRDGYVTFDSRDRLISLVGFDPAHLQPMHINHP